MKTPTSGAKKGFSYRWVVWGILTLGYVIGFFHRLAAGVVRHDLVTAFDISGTTFAAISSAYFYAYMLMQIPTGILADSLGARKTSSLGMALAGVGSILFGWAPSLWVLFAGRIMVGLGVSVLFVSILKILSQWFTESEFATMSGITAFMGNMGGLLAQTPLVVLVALFTWRHTFAVFGIVSMVLAAACYLWVRNRPEEMGLPSITEMEGKSEQQSLQEKPSVVKGLIQVLTNWRTWPCFLMFTGFFGTYVALTGTWGQSYLMEVYQMAPAAATNYLSATVIGVAIGSVVIGQISDRMKRRRLPMIVFGGVYLLCWGVLVFAGGGQPPVQLLYPLFFILGFSSPAYVLVWACGKEVNHPTIAGTSTSVVNIGGFLGGSIMPTLLGSVIDRYTGVIEPILMYQKAFLYCFVAVALSYLAIFIITETRCRNIFAELNRADVYKKNLQ